MVDDPSSRQSRQSDLLSADEQAFDALNQSAGGEPPQPPAPTQTSQHSHVLYLVGMAASGVAALVAGALLTSHKMQPEIDDLNTKVAGITTLYNTESAAKDKCKADLTAAKEGLTVAQTELAGCKYPAEFYDDDLWLGMLGSQRIELAKRVAKLSPEDISDLCTETPATGTPQVNEYCVTVYNEARDNMWNELGATRGYQATPTEQAAPKQPALAVPKPAPSAAVEVKPEQLLLDYICAQKEGLALPGKNADGTLFSADDMLRQFEAGFRGHMHSKNVSGHQEAQAATYAVEALGNTKKFKNYVASDRAKPFILNCAQK